MEPAPFKMAAAQTNSTLAAGIRARAHFDSVILPMWMGPGFNQALGLPFESLDAASGNPLPAERYRAMACARQLYVYAEAGADAAAHADRLFESLCAHFQDARGGWRYSVDAQARPLDETQDLYTHAFIVFACAAYFRRSHNAGARKLMLGAAETIEARFKRPTACTKRLSLRTGAALRGPAQNPMMHLTEAYLAAAQVAEPALFAQRCARWRRASPSISCMRPRSVSEAPQGTPDNRHEPGHQFEWLSLVRGAAEVFDGLELAESLPRAAQWARRHGVDAMGVRAALAENGAVRDDTRRIWAQAEYLRMLAVLGEREALAGALDGFRARFLHAGGWYECLDAQGAVARGDMPSTSPYHLATLRS